MPARRWVQLGMLCAALVVAGYLLLGRSSGEPKAHGVPSSIAADCSRPVDKEITEFLKSVPNHSEIRFPRDACYAQEGTIVLTDRIGLTIDGNGSTFKAVSRGNDNRSNWQIQAGADIVLKNMTARGVHPGFDQERLQTQGGNHAQHGFAIESVQGGQLLNSRAFDVDGDPVGFYPDTRKGSYCVVPPTRNFVVDRFHGFNAARTVAITHADNVTIRNSYFGDIYDAAFDIETDTECMWSRNVRILGNRIGRHHLATLTYVGSEPQDRSGGLEFSGNEAEHGPSSCVPAVYFVPSWGDASRVGFYRNSRTHNRNHLIVRNNKLRTIGDGMRIDYAGDGRIEGNVVTNNGTGGCAAPGRDGKNYLVVLTDSDRVNVHGNQGVTGPGAVGFAAERWVDPSSSEITDLPPEKVPAPPPLPPAPPDGDKETSAPTVSFSEPTEGATVAGVVAVRASAMDPNPTEYMAPNDRFGVIKRVEFSVDDAFVRSDSGPMYSLDWDARAVSSGPHTITATAVDGNDNRASAKVTVNVVAPQ